MQTLPNNTFRCLAAGLLLIVVSTAQAAPAPIVTATQATDERPDDSFGIGLTASLTRRPFVGIGNQLAVLPYFSYRHGQFYIESLDAGYVLYKNRSLRLDVLATPRFYEVKSSFAKNGELDGIDQTNPSYLGGLSAQFYTGPAVITVQYLHDLLESNGNEAVLTASRSFRINPSLALIPSVSATYQDAALVDYYYGVQANEVIAGRPQYAGKATLNYNVTLNAVYNWSRHVDLLGQIKYEVLGDGITDSPIVDQDTVYAITLGAVYRY